MKDGGSLDYGDISGNGKKWMALENTFEKGPREHDDGSEVKGQGGEKLPGGA